MSFTIVENISFIIEFIVQCVYSERFKTDIDSFTEWLIENSHEGKKYIKTKEKMSNVLGMLIVTLLNAVFTPIKIRPELFMKYDNFDYKLEIIKNGIKK